MFSFVSKHKPIIGLDIGTTSIKAVELRRQGKGWNLQRIGSKPLPPKAVTNGKIKDKAAVVQVIRDLWTANRFGSKRAAISVGGPSVIIKRIQLPLMTELDMEDQISTEAEEHIPFDIDEVYLDFQILNRTEETMELLLTACKKELVDNRLEAVREAGLEPVLCDLDIFCVANAHETLCLPGTKNQPVKKTPAPDKNAKSDATVLVNAGSAHLNLAIIANGLPDFTRDHAFGSERIVGEILQDQSISLEDAELMIMQGKDSRNRPWTPDAREPIVHAFLEQMGNLVKQSVEFFNASHPNHRIAGVYLSGGCAMIPEAVSSVHTLLNLPVERANPLLGLGGGGATGLRPETSPGFMVAMGLALRGDAS